VQQARDQVFELAMALHKAFVDAAAKPLRHNLELLLRTFFGKLAWSPKVKPWMPDLWSSFFLVVPVVSTTFASVERMLGALPSEALGWLLVDEAGQAVPQAVVGAMMRTKRAIIVGDPLQIEPVTSLPTSLAEAICGEFGIDPSKWNAPVASVQSVADATAKLGTEFQRDIGSIRVGFPLLVHRRCGQPMFSLSNAIAYANQMVHAKPSQKSAIRDAIGPSRWIDVSGGQTEGKWCEAEGDAVVELLRRLAATNVDELDLYVISPFVIVAQKLRERVQSSGLLRRWTDEPWKWVRERVGTVHTVQGREADSVIFVLGAPLPAQRGARAWAGGTPNLLNVAATRAKENLYVIGSHAAWHDVGHFRQLALKVLVGASAS
jgi:superfamily I DNA and/or RNA helicase